MNTLAPFFIFPNGSSVSWPAVPVFSITKLVRVTGATCTSLMYMESRQSALDLARP